DANGRLVAQPVEINGRRHLGSEVEGTTYVVQTVMLFANDGRPIRAHTVLSGGRRGKFDVGDIIVPGKGVTSRPGPDNPLCTNCHGVTFADGEYWIDNDQVDDILAGDNYKPVSGAARRGDIVIYRNQGRVVHSATVTALDSNGQAQTVSGLGGLAFAPKETPIGPGPGTAWDDAADVTIHREEPENGTP
ncbi:MAG: hypothetical protein MI919_37990, partial [Holophagales bacterium]|nr:hypothetical protein [Holophagales bacterium]